MRRPGPLITELIRALARGSSQLPAKSEVSQNQVVMGAKDTNERAKPEAKEAKHGREL